MQNATGTSEIFFAITQQADCKNFMSARTQIPVNEKSQYLGESVP